MHVATRRGRVTIPRCNLRPSDAFCPPQPATLSGLWHLPRCVHEVRQRCLECPGILPGCRYFASHLDSARGQRELSVYCDVEVFAWLLEFAAHAASGAKQPQLTPTIAMPILIASSFLQMERLVPMCAAYIAENLHAMVLQGAAVTSLSEPLLAAVCEARTSSLLIAVVAVQGLGERCAVSAVLPATHMLMASGCSASNTPVHAPHGHRGTHCRALSLVEVARPLQLAAPAHLMQEARACSTSRWETWRACTPLLLLLASRLRAASASGHRAGRHAAHRCHCGNKRRPRRWCKRFTV